LRQVWQNETVKIPLGVRWGLATAQAYEGTCRGSDSVSDSERTHAELSERGAEGVHHNEVVDADHHVLGDHVPGPLLPNITLKFSESVRFPVGLILNILPVLHACETECALHERRAYHEHLKQLHDRQAPLLEHIVRQKIGIHKVLRPLNGC
jgi:hypothetical protein